MKQEYAIIDPNIDAGDMIGRDIFFVQLFNRWNTIYLSIFMRAIYQLNNFSHQLINEEMSLTCENSRILHYTMSCFLLATFDESMKFP